MDALSRRAALFGALLGLVALIALPGCKPDVPAHWQELGFPLGAGELRAGADHSNQKITIEHGGIADTSGACGNYNEELRTQDFERVDSEIEKNTDEEIIQTFRKKDGKKLKLVCRNAVDKTIVILDYMSE